MTNKDYVILAVLGALAIFIWVRDLSWVSTADDTLPILVTIPMFFWLGAPWSFKAKFEEPHMWLVAVGVALFLIGLITNITLLLGVSWTTFLWSWLSVRVVPEQLPETRKLLVLPLMAFPWIALDANAVGWWFRLSAATVAGVFFAGLGLPVVQQGTNLTINSVPVSVEAACSGLHTLQSMLIAGSVGAFILLGHTSRYWWNLPMLVVMAWVANTLRIMVICVVAITISPQFAMGPFHEIGGWAVLMIMFGLCWMFFSLQVPKETPGSTPSS